MSKKLSSLILASACWSIIGVVAQAQNTKPVIFTTMPKVTEAKVKSEKTDRLVVSGRVALTVTAANYDDTIVGIVVYNIADEARQKIAEALERDLSTIPTSFIKKEVTAIFRNGTTCPVMHLVIPPVEVEAGDIKMQLERLPLEINDGQGRMAQLICAWSRQINANREHRGIIAAINRLITGETAEQ